MTSAERQQAALDQVSRMIANLDHEERLIVITNSIVFSESSPVTIVSSLAKIMLSLSEHLNDNELKKRVADALHDVARVYESSIERKVVN